jgi:hypothetical protein
LAEEEAHNYAVAMARGYMCFDLDSLQWRDPSPARVEQENRELAGAIAARDEAVAEVARDRAYFHARLAMLEAVDVEAAQAEEAEAATAEAANSMARRVLWDPSLAEALERPRRQDEMSDRRRVRRAECVNTADRARMQPTRTLSATAQGPRKRKSDTWPVEMP